MQKINISQEIDKRFRNGERGYSKYYNEYRVMHNHCQNSFNFWCCIWIHGMRRNQSDI